MTPYDKAVRANLESLKKAQEERAADAQRAANADADVDRAMAQEYANRVAQQAVEAANLLNGHQNNW